MLIQRLQSPSKAFRGCVSCQSNASASVLDAFRALTLQPPTNPHLILLRNATHKSQGSINSKKNGPGKRLGAKKTGGQHVLPSQIIFRQRGTLWHAGENAGCGRDHTIFAKQEGFVRYYSDPRRHAKRKYIGVALTPDQRLPTSPGMARRRRLGMEAVPITTSTPLPPVERLDEGIEITGEIEPEPGAPGTPMAEERGVVVIKKKGRPDMTLRLRPGGMFRQSNWEIGRVAERAGIKVRKFKPGDRFAAWRKRVARKKAVAAKKTLKKRK